MAMKKTTTIGLAAAGTVGAAAAGWTVWSLLANRGLESPRYHVTAKADGYELRNYDPVIVAETEVAGEYREALGAGFRRLFRFISGDNTEGGRISMTTPVTEHARDGAGARKPGTGLRTIAFVMPRDRAQDQLPAPNDPLVRLRPVPARTVAAVRFKGWATPGRVGKKTRALMAAVARHGYSVVSEPETAIYNPPMTVPFLRRNEILVEVK